MATKTGNDSCPAEGTGASEMTPEPPGRFGSVRRYLLPGVLAFGASWLAYRSLLPLAKWLIATFAGVVGVGITIVGFLFNAVM